MIRTNPPLTTVWVVYCWQAAFEQIHEVKKSFQSLDADLHLGERRLAVNPASPSVCRIEDGHA